MKKVFTNLKAVVLILIIATVFIACDNGIKINLDVPEAFWGTWENTNPSAGIVKINKTSIIENGIDIIETISKGLGLGNAKITAFNQNSYNNTYVFEIKAEGNGITVFETFSLTVSGNTLTLRVVLISSAGASRQESATFTKVTT